MSHDVSLSSLSLYLPFELIYVYREREASTTIRHLNPANPARFLARLDSLGSSKTPTLDRLGPPWTALEPEQRHLARAISECHPHHPPQNSRLPHIVYLYLMSSGSSFPEYYVLLGVPHSATTEEIRAAYKRESLRCVPFSLPVLHSNLRFCFI